MALFKAEPPAACDEGEAAAADLTAVPDPLLEEEEDARRPGWGVPTPDSCPAASICSKSSGSSSPGM